MDNGRLRVLFLTTYGRQGGSSRYMVHNYIDLFREAGLECTVSPLFDDRYFGFGLLSEPTGLSDIVRHAGYFVGRVLQRLRALASASRFDLVVIEKQLLPYFPYGVEAILRMGLRRTVSLYDDATHVYYQQHPNRLIRWLCRGKVARTMRASSQVVVWNEHLARYARQHSAHVSVVSTAVDPRRYRVKEYALPRAEGPVVIGWIGTPNSFPYIRTLEDAFRQLAERYDVVLHVVSSEPYASPNIRVVNRQWSIEAEIDELLEFDIGIMPLPDDEWTRGKSAAKAVQYLACALPAVCSPVGISTQLIQDGSNGFLAATPEEWSSKLAALVESSELRREMGLRGRATVEAGHTLEVIAPRLVRALQEAATDGVGDGKDR